MTPHPDRNERPVPPPPPAPTPDEVEEADLESFPASDPPAWTAAIPSEPHAPEGDEKT